MKREPTSGAATRPAARSRARPSPSSTTTPRPSKACGRLFSTWGAAVAGGCDAASALAELGRLERYPDLIVADLRLDRDRNGLDAVATIREELGLRIPALVVSGDTSVAATHAVRSAGFALLPKPVVRGALAAAAAALVASAAPVKAACRAGSGSFPG